MLLAGGGILNVFRLFAGEDILFAVHFLLPEEKTLLSVEKILLRIPCPKTISLSLSLTVAQSKSTSETTRHQPFQLLAQNC